MPRFVESQLAQVVIIHGLASEPPGAAADAGAAIPNATKLTALNRNVFITILHPVAWFAMPRFVERHLNLQSTGFTA